MSLKLLWNCSKTALKLLWNCSETLNRLWNLEIVLKLLWNCSRTLKLLWKCSESALKVLWNFETALKVLWNNCMSVMSAVAGFLYEFWCWNVENSFKKCFLKRFRHTWLFKQSKLCRCSVTSLMWCDQLR